MGAFYGRKIKNQEINPKTQEPWKLEDVNVRWRSAVEKWLADNP